MYYEGCERNARCLFSITILAFAESIEGKTCVRIAGLQANILKRNFPNTKDCYFPYSYFQYYFQNVVKQTINK
jgi:hypothetical protein